MTIDTFLQAFSRIDKDKDGIIYHDELEEYAKSNTVSPDFVEKWKKLFDEDNTGSITFQRFCQVLGISKKKQKEIILNTGMNYTSSISVTMNITVLSSTLDKSKEEGFLDVLKMFWKNGDPNSSLYDALIECDNKFGPRWKSRIIKTDKPEFKDALNNKYIVFNFDDSDDKYCVWTQKVKRETGCCFCF